MLRLVIAGIALAVGSAVPASAADMRLPVKAPPLSVVLSYTGCYLGINGGGGFADKTFTDPLVPAPGNGLGSHTGNGGVVGGQVGCDYQAGVWVVGLRGLWDATSIKGENTSADRFISKVHWFATATARLGVTVTPNVLLYATGGGAWVRDNFNVVDAADGVLEASAQPTRSGWVAGGGVEILTQDGWSFFMEYNYLGFGQRQTIFTNLEAPPAPAFPLDIRQNVQVVMLGINLRFSAR